MRTCTAFLQLLAAVLLLSACSRQTPADGTSAEPQPRTECMVPYTPVKNQGRSALCWVYAMLATIESEHIAKGDSVNLSAQFLGRALLEEQAERIYLTQGRWKLTMRGMAADAIALMQRRGLVHYDAFRAEPNYHVEGRKVDRLARACLQRHAGVETLHGEVGRLLNDDIHGALNQVFFLGAEYTPTEFAHSVCMPDEYLALTSFSHHPFDQPFVLEVPDNHGENSFLNVPIDSLVACVELALSHGHAVCWEGDISEEGFSFARGFAHMADEGHRVTQQQRQQMFESFATTDDHCMELVGLARSAGGRRYYVCKNSWGRNNPFGGLMYMSENYLRAKTIGVWMNRSTFD